MNNTVLNHPILEKNMDISTIMSMLSTNETIVRGRVNLIASENTLSPLARFPFLLDFHSRYFLDDMRRFGKWYFPAGKQIGEIEQDVLIPLLSEMAGAAYVDVRPISGMNCMMVALAAFTNPGDTFLAIPMENGGHVSTVAIARNFSIQMQDMPFSNTHDIDYQRLEELLIKTRPALIYIDQANVLFPIDPQFIRNLVDDVSPETIIHYDSSHVNGLIIGKALFNPLERGAHCYGGSTHKTLPGPHKGFLATNDWKLAQKIRNKADYLISHNHTSSMISLAITLLEMKWCNGEKYAAQVISNAKIFGKELSQNGFYVAAEDRGYTDCHQLWAYPKSCNNVQKFSELLTTMGIIANLFDGLPGISQPVLRLSFAEATRMGATEEDAQLLATIMSDLQKSSFDKAHCLERTVYLCEKLAKPMFCFKSDDFDETNISDNVKRLYDALFMYCGKN